MSLAALTERHRPRCYAQVAGQDEAKSFLRSSVSLADPRFRGRSVLLFGPDGTGKTCLSEIYARALLCRNATGSNVGTGEACDHCRDCDQMARGQHPNFRRLYEEDLQGSGAVDVIGSAVGNFAWAGGWMVVLIDRADRMPATVWDALHRRLERTPTSVTFILTAANQEAVPRRSREALRALDVGELAIVDREELIRRVTGAEAIQIDETTVEVMARLAGGRPRSLLNQLEILAGRGHVTADAVRAHFQDRRAERVLAYLEQILGRASLNEQLAVLCDEDGRARAELARAIRGVLASLFGGPALGVRDEHLPFAFETARARIDLATALLERRTELRLSSREMFSRLIDWWSTPVIDEAALIARISDFDEWLNGPGRVETQDGENAVVGRGRRRTKADLRALERTMGRPAGGRTERGSDVFLDRADVRHVWDGASFLVQKYGVYLTWRLSVCWGPGGAEDKAEISTAITNLQRELGMFIVRRAKGSAGEGDPKFHWVRVHARDAAGARWTHWGIAGLPTIDLKRWVEAYRKRARCALGTAATIEYEKDLVAGPAPSRRHHAILAQVLTGMDPDWRERLVDEAGGTRDAAVADLLGVRSLHAAGAPFLTPRVAVSRFIDVGQRTAARAVLAPLSVFASGALWAATKGWEMREHEYRRTREKERHELMAQLEREWPVDDDRMRDRRALEMKRLEDRWKNGELTREAGRPGFSGN